MNKDVDKYLKAVFDGEKQIRKLLNSGVKYGSGEIVDHEKAAYLITPEIQDKINKIKENIKNLKPY